MVKLLTLKKGNSNVFEDIKGVSKVNVSGHTIRNLSTVINKITPINENIIWTLNLPDLAIIEHYFH